MVFSQTFLEISCPDSLSHYHNSGFIFMESIFDMKFLLALIAISAAAFLSGCSFPISPLMFMVDSPNQISAPEKPMLVASR